jgi:hypothetical protein
LLADNVLLLSLLLLPLLLLPLLLLPLLLLLLLLLQLQVVAVIFELLVEEEEEEEEEEEDSLARRHLGRCSLLNVDLWTVFLHIEQVSVEGRTQCDMKQFLKGGYLQPLLQQEWRNILFLKRASLCSVTPKKKKKGKSNPAQFGTTSSMQL